MSPTDSDGATGGGSHGCSIQPPEKENKTMVRIASFNVENLFERPKAFHATDLAVGNPR